jgi:hypothetical protein
MYECKEKDWKLFRKRLPVWQSNYMEKLFVKYEKIFDSDLDAGERFWTVYKRMKNDSRLVSVSCEMARSKLYRNLCCLLDEESITYDDLEGFSDDLLEDLHRFRDITYK